MTPTLGNGKICYVEMPANDVQRSAEFYEKVFGWKIRTRGDGATAFDDGVGEVSGTWVYRPATGYDAGFVDLHHGRQRGRYDRHAHRSWR